VVGVDDDGCGIAGWDEEKVVGRWGWEGWWGLGDGVLDFEEFDSHVCVRIKGEGDEGGEGWRGWHGEGSYWGRLLVLLARRANAEDSDYAE